MRRTIAGKAPSSSDATGGGEGNADDTDDGCNHVHRNGGREDEPRKRRKMGMVNSAMVIKLSVLVSSAASEFHRHLPEL